MKRQVLLASVPLLIAMTTATPARAQPRAVTPRPPNPLVGAWRLVALDEPGADGTVRPVDATGQFLFTPDGHASVQVMMRRPQAGAPNGPTQYSQGGYEASFGRYTVDQRAHRFSFRIEGALVRALVGKDLVRVYELSHNRLVVTPVSPDEHWRVTWERY
jgi:hypothetical protein